MQGLVIRWVCCNTDLQGNWTAKYYIIIARKFGMGEQAGKNTENMSPGFIATDCSEDMEASETEQGQNSKSTRSPEPNKRRKYSFASMMKILEKKQEEMKENKDDAKEKKLQKKEAQENGKAPKKGIFHLRHKQKLVVEDEAVHCSANGVYLIPPVPSQLGYSDLLVEEVTKPRSSSFIHASDQALLTDVQRPRSPRNQRQQPQLKSEPVSVCPPKKTLRSPPTPSKLRNGLQPDSGNESNEKHSPKLSRNTITNKEIRSLAQSELVNVLKGQFFHPKQVPNWSKTISERIMLKVRKLTNNEKKVIATVFIGEKFPGTVEVYVSCRDNAESDNFQTISAQINNIYAWVSVMGLKL